MNYLPIAILGKQVALAEVREGIVVEGGRRKIDDIIT